MTVGKPEEARGSHVHRGSLGPWLIDSFGPKMPHDKLGNLLAGLEEQRGGNTTAFRGIWYPRRLRQRRQLDTDGQTLSPTIPDDGCLLNLT